MTPAIVVHGGAGRIADEHHQQARRAVADAAEAGRSVLVAGGDCEAAVLAAVRELEECPVFNAGRGACMTRDGGFEVDAGIMRSRDMASGAVAAVPDLADPISVAQAVMNDSRHCLLVGPGAVEFGRRHGVGRFDREGLWTAIAVERWERARAGQGSAVGQADTVGAVAIDRHGALCAGGSTGGVLLQDPGRVGDCPLVGAGLFASAALGAACATGVGEAILTHVASYAALTEAARAPTPEHAVAEVCARVAATPIAQGTATCGIILIDPHGQVAVAHHSPHMSWAIARGTDAVEAGLQR